MCKVSSPETETVRRFLPADALWNLAMAINVYMTLFRKYNARQLKALVRTFPCDSSLLRPKPKLQDILLEQKGPFTSQTCFVTQVPDLKKQC